MIRILLICFLINYFSASAQKVIVIDLASKNVSVNGTAAKALKYNNRDEKYFQDLLHKHITDMILINSSHGDTMYLLKNKFLDSLLNCTPSRLFNCFNSNNKEDAFFPNEKTNNKNSFHNNYDGLVLNDSIKATIIKVLPSGFSHLVVLTSYRVYNPNSIFALSADVLDSGFNKVAGFKKEFKRSVSRTSSPELLNYYTQKSIALFFETLKGDVLTTSLYKK